MTDKSLHTETGVDQDLLPERSNYEDLAWYAGGASAAAFILGVLGTMGNAPSFESLALVGGIGIAGITFRMVRT